MTEQRMTTLISRAPFMPLLFKKNLAKAETEIRRWLQDRGVQFSPADFAALIENISPAASQGVLSYALDFIRPLAVGIVTSTCVSESLAILRPIPTAKGRIKSNA